MSKEAVLKEQAERTPEEREAVARLHETKDEYDEPACSVDSLGLAALIVLAIVFFVSLFRS